MMQKAQSHPKQASKLLSSRESDWKEEEKSAAHTNSTF
jgi:hypothetical protein